MPKVAGVVNHIQYTRGSNVILEMNYYLFKTTTLQDFTVVTIISSERVNFAFTQPYWSTSQGSCYTVEPLGTDTSLIRTPLYYGQFPMSQQNSHIFSLNKPL